MNPTEKRQKLTDMVVTIELTLLSVIQGVALYFLADNARSIFLSLDFVHWIYAAIAFMILITFWSQALMHVMSFISWPLEFLHNFLYFLVVICEVLMFASMTDPLRWFMTNAVFFLVSGLLYFADLWLLESKEPLFTSENQRAFYLINRTDQRFAFMYLVPLGFVFSLLCAALIYNAPGFFIAGHWHLLLAGIQAVFGLATLWYLIPLFRKRMALIDFL